MIPHVKIALSLLVAASKVHLIFTGGGGFVPDVLHKDIMHSGTASTSTGIDSLAAQIKPEVAGDDREATRMHKTDGDHAIPDGKQIVPLDKTEILVPSALKVDEDTTKAMELEYSQLVLLLDDLRVHILPRECRVAEETFLSALHKLSDYHKRYLLGPGFDSQHAHDAIIKDLRKIFDSLTFPHPSQYHLVSVEEKDQRLIIRSALRVKTGFEKCVFKTLDCLYRFKIITREEMRTFFNSPDTLQRTATHLLDLFSGPQWTFTAYHTFTPEIDFILKDWHTEHLHRCLTDLDEAAQQQLVYETVRITIENLKYFDPGQLRSPASLSTTAFVSQGAFFQTFQRWAASHLPDEDDLLNKNVKEMIKLFLQPRDSDLKKTDRLRDLEKIELLINYYTLRFIKEYANRNFNKLIDKFPTGEDFESKFQWLTLELEHRKLLRWREDYDYFFIYPEEVKSLIPSQLTEENRYLLFKQISLVREKMNKFHPMSSIDNKETTSYNAFVRYIMGSGEVTTNSWLRPRDIAFMAPTDEAEVEKLISHLVDNYDELSYTLSVTQRTRAIKKLFRTFRKEIEQRQARSLRKKEIKRSRWPIETEQADPRWVKPIQKKRGRSRSRETEDRS